MKTYKLLLLAFAFLLYNCGSGTGPPASNSGTTSGTTATLGSIEFTSATPNVVRKSGTGAPSTSTISFTVKDNDGNAISGAPVIFTLAGPGGGETITASSATTSTGGIASTILNSGLVSGIVKMTASVTIDSTTKSTTTSAISIGGGVASDRWFSVARTPVNLEGLAFLNIQSTVTVLLGDRFGNYNILEGTTLSFYAESGAIDASAQVDATGVATVTYRTQNPIPEDVAVLDTGAAGCDGTNTSLAGAISSTEWELCLQEYVAQAKGVNTAGGGYAISTTNNPRDGWAKIMASTTGEEAFDDADADGEFDTGEFTIATQDTSQEAFLDLDDDDTRDTSPFEIYIDDDGDSSYDAANTIWDSNKTIFEDLDILITGSPAYIEFNMAGGFNIANDASLEFRVLVADTNLNHLIGGSVITISKTGGGTLVGNTTYTFPDIFTNGPKEMVFTIDDADTTTSTSESVVITVKVTWKGTDYENSISGTVN